MTLVKETKVLCVLKVCRINLEYVVAAASLFHPCPLSNKHAKVAVLCSLGRIDSAKMSIILWKGWKQEMMRTYKASDGALWTILLHH